jgi:hypothetical protein
MKDGKLPILGKKEMDLIIYDRFGDHRLIHTIIGIYEDNKDIVIKEIKESKLDS